MTSLKPELSRFGIQHANTIMETKSVLCVSCYEKGKTSKDKKRWRVHKVHILLWESIGDLIYV